MEGFEGGGVRPEFIEGFGEDGAGEVVGGAGEVDGFV